MNGTLAAQVILLALAVAFVCAATLRYRRDGRIANATRTWLIVAAIFTLVSGWLYLMNPGR